MGNPIKMDDLGVPPISRKSNIRSLSGAFCPWGYDPIGISNIVSYHTTVIIDPNRAKKQGCKHMSAISIGLSIYKDVMSPFEA